MHIVYIALCICIIFNITFINRTITLIMTLDNDIHDTIVAFTKTYHVLNLHRS